MAATIGSDQWWADLQRQHEKERQKRRDDFFASGERIPDLDLMPPCSICEGGLEYDERFYCPECNVEWSRGGMDGERVEG